MTTATRTRQTPLDRLLLTFPGLRQRSNGWWAHEDSPRFDALELANGDIRINSWTGRSVDDILAMGDPQYPIQRAHLYAKPGQSSAAPARDKLDLLTLAQYMCLDWRFLMQEGYSDGYTYTYSSTGNTVRCVKVGGYFTPTGEEHSKHQVRLSLHENPRFLFDQNTPGHPLPCGLHHLDRAREAGYLVIGEGSSDWATMTFHGFPFIGLPGASHAKSLDVALVKDLPTIYIIEEPDQVKSLNSRGEGFYKSVRKHLRNSGYAGDIFSIRFEEATGFKDPSDLHKAIYAECKQVVEIPFWQDVHGKFRQAIEQALENALPEGNTGRSRAIVRDLAHMSFEEFYREVWAVPTTILSPIQKGIVCYLFLYMRETEADALGWRFDASELAPRMGFIGKKGIKTLQGHISYLHQKVGILDKKNRARKEYINGEEGPEIVRYKGTDIYIFPSPSFFTPRGYCAPLADQHQPGGPREKQEQPPVDLSRVPTECELCGRTHIRPYAAECLNPGCDGHVTYPPIVLDEDEQPSYSAPVPMQSEGDDPDPEPVIVVESTLADSSDSQMLKDEKPEAETDMQLFPREEAIPEVPKMGTSDKSESITGTHFGYLGNPSQSPPLHSAPYPPEDRPSICHGAGWQWNGERYVCEQCHGKREQAA